MSDCIFCKIVKNELPSYKIYEDDFILAFLDINPVNPGHTLIIPKEHYSNMEAIPNEILSKIILKAKEVGIKIKENLKADSFNVCQNNDKEAGQLVPHLHFHVIPRNDGDGLRFWPQGEYREGEAEEVIKKII